MEELQESDMFWSNDNRPITSSTRSWPSPKRNNSNTQKTKESEPIEIPRNNKRPWKKLEFCNSHRETSEEEEEEYLGVPPHVIVSRRMKSGGRMAFSVCAGHGRTLKGRDLRRVRNSILRMTGFIEA
ncbi:hypothetical protein QJS04_geneDACA008337 [Acorus gramineus]|uniref:Senescence regulator S40 n=1 Tax=Acorus gramineus TaxID=55184 RepID=A0AAV9AW11_ACOGR|nr:hypothetical protein QJS04_geneDACA008337 [Acorus gramineus]